ncbi:MAG: DUF2283 domain-containing protein [Firmicutes bacterium]|nr:DUF2283 domain-containing protein [Bacillota bacterium]
MELRYDPKYNVAYIRFRQHSEEIETVRLSDEVLVDIAPDGRIFGIELLNANEQLGILHGLDFRFTDESTGFTVQVPLKQKSA